MTKVECITRKIGSSIGIILPSDVVKRENILPNQNIRVDIKKQVIKKQVKGKDVFGLLPGLKGSAQEMKNEARKGW